MKKLLAIMMAALMALSLVACGDKPANTPDTTKATTTEATTTTEETTTEATTTTVTTTTEATTTTPAPDPLVYIESLFTKIAVAKENHVDLQVTNEQLEEGSEAAVWDEDGDGVLVNGATLISFNLPEAIPLDTTLVVYIKGNAEDNFRCWLLDEGVVTSSNQINMQNDMKFFSYGDYEFFLELTAQYYDADVANNMANKLCFKAPSWDSTLTNLTIDQIGIFEGTLEEYRAACENPEAYAPAEGEVTEAPEAEGEAPAEDIETEAEAPADEADAPAEE